MRLKHLLEKNLVEILVILIGSFFGFILMFSTFYEKNNTIYIASKAWSDFASHIPLIRSFSLGFNFPPQYPLFPGEPIKYHFLFYYFVGLLEKIGLNIGLALNIPSFFGFLLLVFMIYIFSKEIFKSKAVGVLSILFFLFNSSLSYVYFFKKFPISLSSINQITKTTDFQSFAPYGQGLVTAFWNLNIYTNQRHLAMSLALSLFIIYLVIKPLLGKKTLNLKTHVALGIILGLSFFLHTAVFLMTCLAISCLLLTFPKIRKGCLILVIFAAATSLPQYLYLSSSSGYSPHFVLGYLISNNLTAQKFIEFWVYNFGLSLILIPLGFIFANKLQKKVFLSFFILFIIGNTIQFSAEIAANHKFFNYFLIIGNMLSAYFLVFLWKKKYYLKLLVPFLFLFMILGGIIDFFPIYNDRKIELPDYKINKDSSWIISKTNPNSIFLNTTYLYDPASIAGRKIFMGWPYFAWSQGYNTDKRGQTMKSMLSTNDKATACRLLEENKINYIEIKIQNPPDPNIPPISTLYNTQFIKSYENSNNNYSIFSVDTNCL